MTLSNPAKKQWYDNQLEIAPATPSGDRKGLAVAAVVVLVLVAGGAWYSLERSKARELVRLEEQRILIEQEKVRHLAEIEKARLLETQQARVQGYDYRRESANASRAERNMRGDRDRRLAENDRRQAQADVERQKRFVAEREREEEPIRTERHYRAEREAADLQRREAQESARRDALIDHARRR